MWIVTGVLMWLAVAPSTPRGSPPQGPSYTSEEALRRYAQARLLEERGASTEALGEYFRILMLDPRSTGSMRHISELAAQAGDANRSLELAQRAIEADSTDARAWWLRGGAQFNLGRGGEALASLQRAVELDSSRAEYARTLARVAESQDRYDVAAAAYRNVVDKEWDDAESWFQLAAAEARLGHFRDAQQALNEAEANAPNRPGSNFLAGLIAEGEGRDQDAIARYRRHLEVHTDDQVTRQRLVHLLASQKRYGEALVEARVVAHAQPDDMDALEDLADLGFRAGKSSEAYRALQQMAAMGGDPVANLTRRLDVLAHNKRGKEAQALATSWSREHPGDYRGPLMEASALATAGMLEQAIPAARRAVEMAPDSLGPRLVLGRIYQGGRRWADAEAVWEGVLARRPDLARVGLDLAFCRQEQGDLKGSEAAARQVLARAPDDANALNYLGYQLADENRELEEAYDLLRRATALEPDNGAFVDSMGWVLYRMGRLAEARRELERAVQLTNGDATVREHLGDVYRDLELHDLAREQYQKSLTEDATNRDRLRGKLQSLR